MLNYYVYIAIVYYASYRELLVATYIPVETKIARIIELFSNLLLLALTAITSTVSKKNE